MRHSLTTHKLNTIFVILQFQSKFGLILRKLNEIQEKISKFDEINYNNDQQI